MVYKSYVCLPLKNRLGSATFFWNSFSVFYQTWWRQQTVCIFQSLSCRKIDQKIVWLPSRSVTLCWHSFLNIRFEPCKASRGFLYQSTVTDGLYLVILQCTLDGTFTGTWIVTAMILNKNVQQWQKNQFQIILCNVIGIKCRKDIAFVDWKFWSSLKFPPGRNQMVVLIMIMIIWIAYPFRFDH